MTSAKLNVLVASCTLQFLFGSLYALSVFVGNSPDSGATISSLGVVAFATAFGITGGGYLLHTSVDLGPLLYVSSSLHLGLLGLFAGVANGSFMLAFFGAILSGAAFGLQYVTSVVKLQQAFPENPGLVTGFGMFSSGFGSIVLALVYQLLEEKVGWSMATTIVAISNVIGSLLASVRLMQGAGPVASGDDEKAPLVAGDSPLLTSAYALHPSDSSIKLEPHSVITDPKMPLYLLAFSAGVGPGYGIVVGFQQMAKDVFEKGAPTANRYFLLITLAGLVGRLAAGFASDSLRTDSLVFSNAGKNTLFLLVVIQALTFPAMMLLQNSFNAFMIGSCLIYFVFSGAAVAGSLAARELFGASNGELVFGFTGIAVGIGDLTTSWVVQLQVGCSPGDICSLESNYATFFTVAALWSCLGVVAVAILTKSRRAFPLYSPRQSTPCGRWHLVPADKLADADFILE